MFVGIDDVPSGDDVISVMAGSLSATVLHAEFQSRCPDGKWRLLIPNDTTQITRGYLIEQLKRFLRELPKSEGAMIYFAGHGCSYEGKYIFCPQDFREDVPDATGLTFELVSALVHRFRDKSVKLIIVFDTCRTQIDETAQVGEAIPPNCSIVFTCAHGEPVIEIDGYSDFVRRVLSEMDEFGAIDGRYSQVRVLDLINDLQMSRARGGSGTILRLSLLGDTLADMCFSLRSEPSLARQKVIFGCLTSRPKLPGACGRLRGEMLNKITHATGVPMDPNVVQVTTADAQGSEIIKVVLPLARPIKSASVLEYIVREWSYLFTDLRLSIPSHVDLGQLSLILRSHQFDIWSADGKTMALRKVAGSAAKIELRYPDEHASEIVITCLGEDEKWGLERLGDLFVPVVRDLLESGMSR